MAGWNVARVTAKRQPEASALNDEALPPKPKTRQLTLGRSRDSPEPGAQLRDGS
jgi:hypothetical protein